MQVFLNTGFICEEEAGVNPLSAGFMYGYGVFETIKVYNQKISFFEEHYKRLSSTLLVLGLSMEYSCEDLFCLCEKLLKQNSLSNGFVKIICSKGKLNNTDIFIYAGNKKYQAEYITGLKICLAKSYRNSSSPLCYLKSLNYLENEIEARAARAAGYDEALFLNAQGDICEGSKSNIFWAKKGQLFTPSLECGLLPGIIRDQILLLCREEKIEVFEGKYNLSHIKDAEEIFLTNSLMEIMPVSNFEERQFDLEKSILSQRLAELFKAKYYMA